MHSIGLLSHVRFGNQAVTNGGFTAAACCLDQRIKINRDAGLDVVADWFEIDLGALRVENIRKYREEIAVF